MLRKSSNIISKVKSRVRKVTQKFGIKILTSLSRAKELDRKNGNTLWIDAWNKEMSNVSIAFEIKPHGYTPPPSWLVTSGHLVWDIKMDFTPKARWVKDGHKTADIIASNYAGVVSRESVRIAFTYAALNGLPVWAADIQNAYFQAPSSEKHYVVCGDEFGDENYGKIA